MNPKERISATMDTVLHQRIAVWANRQPSSISFSEAVSRAAAIGIAMLERAERASGSLLTTNLQFTAGYTEDTLCLSNAGRMTLTLPPGSVAVTSTAISFTPIGTDPARSLHVQAEMDHQLVLGFYSTDSRPQRRLRHLPLVDDPTSPTGLSIHFPADHPREVVATLRYLDGTAPPVLDTDAPLLSGFIHLLLEVKED